MQKAKTSANEEERTRTRRSRRTGTGRRSRGGRRRSWCQSGFPYSEEGQWGDAARLGRRRRGGVSGLGRAESKPRRGRDLYCPPLAPPQPPLLASSSPTSRGPSVWAGCAAWLPLGLAPPARRAVGQSPRAAPLARAGPRTRHVISGRGPVPGRLRDGTRSGGFWLAEARTALPPVEERFALACMDDQFRPHAD